MFTSAKYEYPNGITYANMHDYQFIHYIDEFGLDEKAVNCINQIFSFATYGSFYDQIRRFMETKPQELENYKRICQEKRLTDYSEKVLPEN